MEILLFLVLLVLILVLRSNIVENNELLKHLRRSVEKLEQELRQKNTTAEAPPGPVSKPVGPEEETKPSIEIIDLPSVPPLFIGGIRTEPAPEERRAFSAPDNEAQKPPVFEAPGHQAPADLAPGETWIERWLRNNPDIEKFIGENLINKVGIAVLVLGIAFFVKYAIDKEWINELARVGIGLLCGGILIALAHKLRNSYRSFSSVLVGGGLTVFYFTMAIAFHEYTLIGQTPAFIIMVVITSFAVALSLLYNRIELAILATLGGFITPFLVSSGNNNYVALFTYLAVLNAGLIVLAYFKNWRVLNVISLFFTIVIFGSWYIGTNMDNETPYRHALIFSTVFYFLFLVMNLVSQLNKKGNLKGFDFAILLTINLTYYSAGLNILEGAGLAGYKGIFTAGLGVLNLTLAYTLFKYLSKGIDRKFVYLLVGLTITYISLTAPVQLEGNNITLFWAAESVLLLWLYQRSFIKLIKLASLLVTVCMLVSLFIDWANVYYYIPGEILPTVVNKGFITSIFAAGAVTCLHLLMRKEADTYYLAGITNKTMRNAYAIIAVALFYIAGCIEIGYQFDVRFSGISLDRIYLQLFTISLATTLLIIADSFRKKVDDHLRLVVTIVIFILYLANTSKVYTQEINILTSGKNTVHLLAWIFNAIAIIAFLLQSFFYIIRRRQAIQPVFPAFVTVLSLAMVIMISIEIRNAYIWSVYTSPTSIEYFENLYSKAFLSVIWGLASFGMIWMGMKYRFKSLRIAALALFGITLVKLFTFDIRNIPAGGKIAAFILLGILLLVISFMYQRLKKLLIDHAETE